MKLVEAVADYERWLAGFMPIVRPDLERKHRLMASGIFPFFRATYFRWCQRWSRDAGEIARASEVLSVGDLHVENFGTWRDSDGRLIWGINDFDEAAPLPWTHDLVRLATSAHLAIAAEHLTLRARDACDAILDGYAAGIAAGGRPFVLEEMHGWLREAATTAARRPTAFWDKLAALPRVSPRDARPRQLLTAALPEPGLPFRLAHRVAGCGSLGRPRFVAIADWRGGLVAREAKALAPAASAWAARRRTARIDYARIVAAAVRVPDPFLHVVDKWVIRRLAPHCVRIELHELPKDHDEARLLTAMGFETANIHLGATGAHLGAAGARARIARELRDRRKNWLHREAKVFGEAVVDDWERWRRR